MTMEIVRRIACERENSQLIPSKLLHTFNSRILTRTLYN